jgi:hypothetical protein
MTVSRPPWSGHAQAHRKPRDLDALVDDALSRLQRLPQRAADRRTRRTRGRGATEGGDEISRPA